MAVEFVPTSGFIGSSSILSSTSNEELIPKKLILHKFSFSNQHECRIQINNSKPIFLLAGQGFNTDSQDAPIKSFIIIDSGINYTWLGAFKNVTL